MKQKYKIHTIEKQQTTFFINLINSYNLIITLHFTYYINLSPSGDWELLSHLVLLI